MGMVYPAISHVAPFQGRWTVEEEGGLPAATCAEKDTALRLGKELARTRHAHLVVHREDGSVHAEHTY
jgi:hypothetical protein